MSAAGVGDTSEVVAYDDNKSFMAARLLWALRIYGHDRVRVLDGGWPAWYAAGAHIPGAVRLPAPLLVQPENGTVRHAAEVRGLLTAAGLDADRPIALYCGGGVSAAEAFMALRIAGIQTARVYDGSWTEWGADPATPKTPHRNG